MCKKSINPSENSAKENSKSENQIRLINGDIIEGFPKKEATAPVKNAVELDTTGQYLIIGNRKRKKHEPTEEEIQRRAQKAAAVKLFADNAFLFLCNCERIRSDSRMFLAPVEVESCLAYFGTGGFRNPTLGIYIEWWLDCLEAAQEVDDKHWLVYYIAGSPLSGCNSCGLVSRRGETKSENIRNFSDAWRPFIKINSYYDAAKSKYEAYSLQQVIDILKKEKRSIDDNALRVFFYQHKIDRLEAKNKYLEEQVAQMTKIYHESLFAPRAEELKQAMAERKEKQANLQRTIDEIDARRRELKRRLKAGEIDNKTYQARWHPLHNQRDDTVDIMRGQDTAILEKLFPHNCGITISEIEEFLKKSEQ